MALEQSQKILPSPGHQTRRDIAGEQLVPCTKLDVPERGVRSHATLTHSPADPEWGLFCQRLSAWEFYAASYN